MAKYNRDFLVPYLADICALHIAEYKLEQKSSMILKRHNRLYAEADKYQRREPKQPAYEDVGIWLFGIILGALLIIISWFDIVIISFLAGLAGWPMAILSLIFYVKGKRANDDLELQYQFECVKYNKEANRKTREYNKYMDVAYAEQVILDRERKKVKAAIDTVYAANVIPLRYRDIYTALYLYDWFSTSMSDDLDAALSMFVLEEIKGKLDRMVSLMEEALFNQRMIINNQEKMMKVQEQHHNEMINKLNDMKKQMVISAEEQSRYLSMIEANTAATAYFATAEYLRKNT